MFTSLILLYLAGAQVNAYRLWSDTFWDCLQIGKNFKGNFAQPQKFPLGYTVACAYTLPHFSSRKKHFLSSKKWRIYTRTYPGICPGISSP